jgi:hypothetical protein
MNYNISTVIEFVHCLSRKNYVEFSKAVRLPLDREKPEHLSEYCGSIWSYIHFFFMVVFIYPLMIYEIFFYLKYIYIIFRRRKEKNEEITNNNMLDEGDKRLYNQIWIIISVFTILLFKLLLNPEFFGAFGSILVLMNYTFTLMIASNKQLLKIKKSDFILGLILLAITIIDSKFFLLDV